MRHVFYSANLHIDKVVPWLINELGPHVSDAPGRWDWEICREPFCIRYLLQDVTDAIYFKLHWSDIVSDRPIGSR